MGNSLAAVIPGSWLAETGPAPVSLVDSVPVPHTRHSSRWTGKETVLPDVPAECRGSAGTCPSQSGRLRRTAPPRPLPERREPPKGLTRHNGPDPPTGPRPPTGNQRKRVTYGEGSDRASQLRTARARGRLSQYASDGRRPPVPSGVSEQNILPGRDEKHVDRGIVINTGIHLENDRILRRIRGNVIFAPIRADFWLYTTL